MSGTRDPIVRVNLGGTALFVVATALAAVLFDQPFTGVSVAVDLACFSLGVVAFLWGYWSAVQRSRRDEISVAGMYFLVGKVAPDPVVRRMNGALAVQVTVGLAGAFVRPSTDGKPGSTLAFGILVPMMGLGLNGLWAAHRGIFAPRGSSGDSVSGDVHERDGGTRDVARDHAPADRVTESGSSTGQDEDHE